MKEKGGEDAFVSTLELGGGKGRGGGEEGLHLRLRCEEEKKKGGKIKERKGDGCIFLSSLYLRGGGEGSLRPGCLSIEKRGKKRGKGPRNGEGGKASTGFVDSR